MQSDYTLIRELSPVLIRMDLTLVKKLLQHENLHQQLERIWDNGQNTLVAVHHDTKEIHRALERMKKDGEHLWWEALLGWSPALTGILNAALHPVLIILILIVVCLVLVLYVRVWHMLKRVSKLESKVRNLVYKVS